MKLFIKLFAVLMVALAAQAQAEVKVIAHSSNGATLSKEDVAKIFLGKAPNFPNGKVAVPIDIEEGNEVRDEFYKKATGKDPSQLNAYWSRLIFTGKGKPPKAVADSEEVLELVTNNPNMLGYVSGATDTSGVKVLLSIP